jgi:hypothetical protein
MIISKIALPRRTFLRGVGTTLALPLLDAMFPAMTALAATPANRARRLGYVYIPMGMNAAKWTPSATGALTELSPSLAPLAPHLDYINVLTNTELKRAYGPGNHATGNAAFLSTVLAKKTEGSDFELATTCDQIAAQSIGRETAIPSLELGTEMQAQVGNCDNGLACVYMNSLSWSSPTSPLPSEADPRLLFERLFGDGASPEQRRAEQRRNGSMLDALSAEISGLGKKLGAGDRAKVGEYLESVREVERRIQNAEKRAADPLGEVLPDFDRPLTAPASWEEHVKLMYDLQVLALQADLTRVITFQMAREVSTRTYPQIGVPEPHHPTSHHGNDPVKLEKLAKINQYHVSMFAYYIDRLKSTPDGDGNLLDHSTIMLGSGLGNPDVHDHLNLPIIVAGGAGRMKGGRHIKYDKPTALANVHLTMLDWVGVHLDKFGDSDGKVNELLQPASI